MLSILTLIVQSLRRILEEFIHLQVPSDGIFDGCSVELVVWRGNERSLQRSHDELASLSKGLLVLLLHRRAARISRLFQRRSHHPTAPAAQIMVIGREAALYEAALYQFGLQIVWN